MAGRRADVAFLWLGEMLLIPHLWPIVAALARLRPDLTIDLWISTSVHEALIRSWLTPDLSSIRLRRVPGFRRYGPKAPGQNVDVPNKLAMLVRLAPYLINVKVAVCAEQTSLWLARSRLLRTRFIFTVHGAGPLNYGRARRLDYAWRLLIPSDLEAARHVDNGIRPERILVTGYAKASFAPSRSRSSLFAQDRPTVLYAPHWQAHRSSWPAWGGDIVRRLADQDRWNVIMAPHQRLVEVDPGARAILESVSARPNVYVDLASFAMVDGSYTAAADLYLGDTSSQILEYLARPRPCVLLQPAGLKWVAEGSGDYWRCGETVGQLEEVVPAIDRAMSQHGGYAVAQAELATMALGDTSGAAPVHAAEAILAALG